VESLTVKEISEQEIPQFVDLPYKLYQNDPYWVPELKSAVRELLELSHPSWKHASRSLFMAWKDGQAVGRIAAIIDESHNSYHGEKCGFFGFFETINDLAVSSALLGAARERLSARGMETMRGPLNPSTNDSCGLLISGFDSPPKIMMPYNPPFYDSHLEEFGLSKIKDLNAYIRFCETPISPRIEKIVARLNSRKDFIIRPIRLAALEHELSFVREIYNEAWAENWGFVPMTEDEMSFAAKSFKAILKPDHVQIIEVDNEPAGFSLIVPDVNVALKKTNGELSFFGMLRFLLELGKVKQGRLIMLGVKKKFRNRGFELLLVCKVVETTRKLGWNHGELSWVLEDNVKIINVIEEVGGRLYKKYRIYEMPLSHQAGGTALAAEVKF